MKNTLILFSATLLFACGGAIETPENNASTTDSNAVVTDETTTTNGLDPNFHKYQIKSGIITFQSTMEMMGMKIPTKTVVYFDDYGSKECSEIYKTDQITGKEILSDRNFVKDGFQYICSIENKSGIKTASMGYGTEAPFNMEEAEMVPDGEFKKLGDETICGKICNGYSMVTAAGDITMYGWNGINLKTIVENESMEMKTVTVATKIEENVAIPADKFEVPEGVVISEM